MSLRIIAVGKKHEDWIVTGLERYQKRLKKPYDIEWVLIPHSSLSGQQARSEESARILSKLTTGTYTMLLDETGQNIDSPTFASLLETQFTRRGVTIIIGGAYGVTPELRTHADFVWSLSKLVFPHQLVRLLLIEQIYRAQEIHHGGKYHHF